ncbi:MAG: hypothetical protein IKX23_01600 [Treponema sp.]|nr:hypothetical protein [Treponema sp.]
MEQIILQIDELIEILKEAEKKLKSARTWGFFDIMGGGFVTNVVKHSKINKARELMDRANYLLGSLNQSLKQMNVPEGCGINIGTFATFADFVFDGFLADAYMSHKIYNNIHSVRELKSRLETVRSQLSSYSSSTNYIEQ